MDRHLQELLDQRRKLLALPPGERVERILASPRARELVRSLPATEFWLTIVQAGLDRALPLLPLAGKRQLDFLFDLEAWTGDDFDPVRAGEWLRAFREADPALVARWFREGDEPLVVLALGRMLRVYKLDESTSPDYWPPDRPVPTLDGIYFVEPVDGLPDGVFPALWEGLAVLRARDRNAYEALLEQVLWMIPPEQEDGVRERREGRLAEHGFPPPDEAMEAWAAGEYVDRSAREALARRAAGLPPVSGRPSAGNRVAGLPLPGSLPVPAETAGPVLARSLAPLAPEARERITREALAFAGRYAVASGRPLGDPATHADGLATALAHLELGLEELSGGDPGLAARALAGLPVRELVLAGAGAVQERALRARRLLAGWLARVHLGRERLDEPLEEVIVGLAGPRPLFTSHGEERPFRSLADLRLVDGVLDTVEALGRFLEDVLGAEDGKELPELDPLPAGRRNAREVEWSAVALTTIARAALGATDPRPRPLARGEAQEALDRLLTPEPPRETTGRFVQYANLLALGPAEPFLAGRLVDDAGELPREARPDPRFVRALLLVPDR